MKIGKSGGIYIPVEYNKKPHTLRILVDGRITILNHEPTIYCSSTRIVEIPDDAFAAVFSALSKTYFGE